MWTYIRLFIILVVASIIGHIVYELSVYLTKNWAVRAQETKFIRTKAAPYPEPNKIRAEIRKQELCLANNIYHEAGIESRLGKMAVAQVTLNRVDHDAFPNTICKVVNQRTVKKVVHKKKVKTKSVCQFSWKCQNVKPPSPRHFAESLDIAKKFIRGHRLPELDQALYYHADYVKPGWNKEVITKIGTHIFYR